MRFFRHEWRMNRKAWWVWTLVIGAIVFAFLMLFPVMEDSMKEMTDLYSGMGAFSDAFGMDKLDFGTPMGFFGIEIGVVISLTGAMYAAILGIGMLAKEEGGHTVEFIYTAPKKRGYFIRAKFWAMVTLLLLFDVVILGTGVAGFYAIGEEPEWKKYLLFFLGQYLMQIQIGGMCFGLSAFMRKNNVGLGIGLAFLLYFVNLFANITDEVEKLHYITPFAYCDAAEIFHAEAISLEYLAVGMAMMVVFLFVGGIHYRRKDLYA